MNTELDNTRYLTNLVSSIVKKMLVTELFKTLGEKWHEMILWKNREESGWSEVTMKDPYDKTVYFSLYSKDGKVVANVNGADAVVSDCHQVDVKDGLSDFDKRRFKEIVDVFSLGAGMSASRFNKWTSSRCNKWASSM